MIRESASLGFIEQMERSNAWLKGLNRQDTSLFTQKVTKYKLGSKIENLIAVSVHKVVGCMRYMMISNLRPRETSLLRSKSLLAIE